MENPTRDTDRVVLPPASFEHEQEKINKRWPAAVEYIKKHKLNEVFPGDREDLGIIVQGGLYNSLLRTMERLGVADAFGGTQIPMYVLNVAYPLIDDEINEFCDGKRAVLLVEEGQPNYIEQALNTILRQSGCEATLVGKGALPMAGEYTSRVLRAGVVDFLGQFDAEYQAPEDPLRLVAEFIEEIDPHVPPRHSTRRATGPHFRSWATAVFGTTA